MGDRRKCQTYTASPAEPGGLPVMLGGQPPAAESAAPTFGALDMLFQPTSWGAAWIRKDPVDPAVFAIVPKDSILSAVLPPSYNKIPSPVERRIASLKDRIESNRKSSQEANDKLNATMSIGKRPPGQ